MPNPEQYSCHSGSDGSSAEQFRKSSVSGAGAKSTATTSFSDSKDARCASDAAVVWQPPHQVKPVYERLSAGAAAASAGRKITAFDRGKTMVVTARYSRMGTKMFHRAKGI